MLALREVNDILLQHFDEAISRANEKPRIEAVNERFQIRNGYIEATSVDVFRDHPPAIMEIFVTMANRQDIQGVRASTIRLIRAHLDLIDDTFRGDPAVTSQFIALLKAPFTLVSQLTRMRRYGVLGRYIPEFGAVIGQMQHDLFHIYTVDAHTMMVIRNMRRFHYESNRDTFPVAHHAVINLPKIELLYIAGLFHDIGKGRGGDHSELGATDVVEFCERHGISDTDTELVAWLVRQHLVMSTTAQRKDIHDPEVVAPFAQDVLTEDRLNYLYALTVADINATNPTLWNSWRATLLRQLYVETRRALRRGLDSPAKRGDYVERCKATAYDCLFDRHIHETDVDTIWDAPGEDFFLRHSGVQVANITEAIHRHDLDSGPLLLVIDHVGQVSGEGGTEIFLHTKNRQGLFADSVAALDQLNLDIVDASIATSGGDYCFNSYIVLEQDGSPVTQDKRRDDVRTYLEKALAGGATGQDGGPARLISRQLKQFVQPTRVDLTNPEDSEQSILTIAASDRPGLLALLGRMFLELDIVVHQARIATLGERVEDIFLITDQEDRPITDPTQIDRIVTKLGERIDSEIREAAA